MSGGPAADDAGAEVAVASAGETGAEVAGPKLAEGGAEAGATGEQPVATIASIAHHVISARTTAADRSDRARSHRMRGDPSLDVLVAGAERGLRRVVIRPGP